MCVWEGGWGEVDNEGGGRVNSAVYVPLTLVFGFFSPVQPAAIVHVLNRRQIKGDAAAGLRTLGGAVLVRTLVPIKEIPVEDRKNGVKSKQISTIALLKAPLLVN